jgi:hypothetical protein
MRKNKKITKKRSVAMTNTMHFGAVIVILSAVVILNILASSSCQQIQKSIGKKEKSIAAYDDEIRRAQTRWESTKSNHNVERALRKHGLLMNLVKPHQHVRVKKDGTLLPNQASVRQANERAVRATAMVSNSRRGRRN